MRLTTGQKKTAGLGSEAVSKTTNDAPVAPRDYHPALVKLATLAALFVVQLAGGCALVGFWVWRSVNA
jgi:hypothetical protein